MAQVEAMIDCIRIADICPERTLILKQMGAEAYLPIWISPRQADILAAQLTGQPDKDGDADLFLSNINAADTDIRRVTLHLEENTFYAKLQLSRQGRPYVVRCSIGVGLALASRANAPILVDEAVFDKAGVRLV